MKKLIISLLFIATIAVQAQDSTYIYRLQFDSQQQAQQVEQQLSDSLLPYLGETLSVVGLGYLTIEKQYVTEEGDTIPAVIDTKYSATTMTKIKVPELMPYVVDVPYWIHRYAAEKAEWIVKPTNN